MTKSEKSNISKTSFLLSPSNSKKDGSSHSFSDKFASIEHVKSLAFNRMASTTGEIKTIEYIKSQLEMEGIEILESGKVITDKIYY